MNEQRIGDVPRVEWNIHQDADSVWSFEWWEDDDETVPVPLQTAWGSVAESMDAEAALLNLEDYISIEGNKVTVHLEAETTRDLEPMQRGVFDFFVQSQAGEDRKVLRGTVNIHRKVPV